MNILHKKSLKPHLSPVFRLQNNHSKFYTGPHKLKLCTKELVLKGDFKDLLCTNIIIIRFVAKKEYEYMFKG